MHCFLTMSSLDDLQCAIPCDFKDVFQTVCKAVQQTNDLNGEGRLGPVHSLSWLKTGAFQPNCSVWNDFLMIAFPG